VSTYSVIMHHTVTLWDGLMMVAIVLDTLLSAGLDRLTEAPIVYTSPYVFIRIRGSGGWGSGYELDRKVDGKDSLV